MAVMQFVDNYLSCIMPAGSYLDFSSDPIADAAYNQLARTLIRFETDDKEQVILHVSSKRIENSTDVIVNFFIAIASQYSQEEVPMGDTSIIIHNGSPMTEATYKTIL